MTDEGEERNDEGVCKNSKLVFTLKKVIKFFQKIIPPGGYKSRRRGKKQKTEGSRTNNRINQTKDFNHPRHTRAS